MANAVDPLSDENLIVLIEHKAPNAYFDHYWDDGS